MPFSKANHYVYCFVRQDLTLPQQVVQACHACIESARLLPSDAVHPHLVVLGASSEPELSLIALRLQQLGIQFRPFYEPDIGGELTAIATERLSQQRRKPLRRYRCWKAKTHSKTESKNTEQ